MNPYRTIMAVLLWAVLCSGLLACGSTPSPTAVPTPLPPTPSPLPAPRTLTVCQGQEPDTLLPLGGSTLGARHVMEAIYDGPIDSRSFDYQPVILEKLPSLADGDATFKKVIVKEGDVVVDDAGEVGALFYDPDWDPVWLRKIRPAGCYRSDCAVYYTGGEVEMNQMVVTFTLRAGVTWADGVPVKASDSVYTYQLLYEPDVPLPFLPGKPTASYQAVDERIVVWVGLPGYRDRTYFTNFWTPLPEHHWGHLSTADLVRSEEAARTPMGYGPFTVQEWVPGDHITVVRNPYYFRADEGLPRFDQVIFRFIGDDPNLGLTLLLTGECDILTQDLSLDRVADLMLAMEAKGQVKPAFAPGSAFEHVDFGIDPVDSYERPDFFQDVRMRRATAMCLDRQQVMDVLFYGRSEPIASYIPPEHSLYDPELGPLPYDPEAAQALLEEMGWRDSDGDGFREAHGVAGVPDGTALCFKWSSTAAQRRFVYMRMFQENLRGCGIKLVLDNMPASEFFADGPEGPLFGRRFDLASFSWMTAVEPPCALYICSEIPREGNGWAGENISGYCSAEFDGACSEAEQALPGTSAYEYYHRTAQRIFVRDLPSVPLYRRVRVAATRPEIRGFILDVSAVSEMWNIEEFDWQ